MAGLISAADLVDHAARAVIARREADEEHARRVASLIAMRDADYADLMSGHGWAAPTVARVVESRVRALGYTGSLAGLGVSHDTVLRAQHSAPPRRS